MKYRWRRLLVLVMAMVLLLNQGTLTVLAKENADDADALQENVLEADSADEQQGGELSEEDLASKSDEEKASELDEEKTSELDEEKASESDEEKTSELDEEKVSESDEEKMSELDEDKTDDADLMEGDSLETDDLDELLEDAVSEENPELMAVSDEDESEKDTNLLQDGSFEVENWADDAPWKFEVEGWDDTTKIKWSTEKSHDGIYYIDYYSEPAKLITVSQSVTLEAGTYKLKVWDQGANGTFQLFLGDQKGEAVKLTGWGNWVTAEETFVVKDSGTYKVGVYLNCEAGGWGYLDDMSLVKVSDDSGDNSEEGYAMTVTPATVNVEPGETVTLTAVVTNDGKKITDLEEAGLSLWWWTDTWAAGHENGLNDAEYSNYDDNSGKSLTADVKLPSQGTYYIVAQLKDSNGELAKQFITCTVESNTTVEADIDVAKVPNLSDDFIMGMDISSVMSEFASGVTYKDFEGNTINNVTDFCKFLKECGVTSIRVRIWNNPYDNSGNGYGGGNNDIDAAVQIAKGCNAAGLDMLLDFHCSDFWTDPGKQQEPKAWKGYTVDQKVEALKTFLTDSLGKVKATGANIAMVQVGNETTGGFIGETSIANMCTLFNAGAEAVHDFDSSIKVVIHVTNPESGKMTTWAKNLDTYKVDYDVLATSYYPSWHGTFANLKSQLQTVRSTYGKEVMVAETSYAFTLEETDGHENTIRKGTNDTMQCETQYPFSVQGQASYLRDIINVVNEAGGLGVFYWESAWITVGDTTGLTGEEYDNQVAANKTSWEKNGSGWASSYSAQYDPDDAGKWFGGSAVDNQAMFAADGSALASINVWKLVGSGAESIHISVESIASVEESIAAGGSYTLPEKVLVTYNKGSEKETVIWDEEDVAAINVNVSGTYKVNGTVTFSKEVDSGKYAGQTTAPTTYTLTVKAPNLIGDDWSFEKGSDNFSGLDSTGKGITGETPYEGNKCLHWYQTNAGTAEVTYKAGITLEPGVYTFECMAQGGSGDTVAVKVLSHGTDTVLAVGDAITMAGWKVWKTPDVSFTVNETITVDLQMVISIQAGGWGTIDCMYLYKTAGISTTITNNKTNITVSGEQLDGLELVVDEVVESSNDYAEISEEIFQTISRLTGKEYSDIVPYDIHLCNKSGETVELHTEVTVKIPVPEGWVAARVKVFHIADDGTGTDMNAAVDETDRYVQFTTNHFSLYVLALEKETQTEDGGDKNENNQPGDDKNDNNQPEYDTPNTNKPDSNQSGTSAPTGNQEGSSNNNVENNSRDNGNGNQNTTQNTAPVITPIKYVVIKGDCLGRIARKLGISLAQILAWNPQIKNPNLIYPGQEIVVGYTTDSMEAELPQSQNDAVYVVVQKGDSLYRIAIRNKISLNEVISLNPELAKQKYIYAGQKVRVR